MPRAGREVGRPRWMRSLGGRGEAEPGSRGCQPPPDTAPQPPPPPSAPFSTSSIHRGRERVTHARRPPRPAPSPPPSSSRPPFPATLARSVPPSPGGFQPNFARWVRAGKRGCSGTSRLLGPTAAGASRAPSEQAPRPAAQGGWGSPAAGRSLGFSGELELEPGSGLASRLGGERQLSGEIREATTAFPSSWSSPAPATNQLSEKTIIIY